MEDKIKKLIEDMQEIAGDIEGGDYWNKISTQTLTDLCGECLRMADITFGLRGGDIK